MSLKRTLKRLARLVAAEARRNPEFAARIEAALAAHDAKTLVSQAVPAIPSAPAEPAPTPAISPIALMQKAGEAGLRAALAGQSSADLAAILAEHNLDPAGLARGAGREAMIDQAVTQAKRRVERDRRMFDY